MAFTHLKNRRGFTILTAVLAGVVVFGSVAIYSVAQSTATRKQNDLRQSLLAKAYAIELLELFRSFERGSSLVKNYLMLNRPGQANGYPLCSKVNVFNRTNETTALPDPVADLPPNPLDLGTPALNAHRSYQIQVIDARTLEILTDAATTAACAAVPTDPATVNSLPDYALLALTVTVTWIPKGGTIANEQQLQLSNVLPVMGRVGGQTL